MSKVSLKEILIQLQENVKDIPVFNELTVSERVDELLEYKKYYDKIGWTVIPVVIYRGGKDSKYHKHPVVYDGFKVNWDRDELVNRIKRIVKGITRKGSLEIYLGFGLLTGKVNRITAIDFDSIPKWEEFQKVFKGQTLAQKTNNGYHVIFKYIENAKNGTGKGVDVRNDNGFIVTLPAKGYKLLIPEGEEVIAEADEAVISFLRKEGLIKEKDSIKKRYQFLSRTTSISGEGIKIKNFPLLIESVRKAYLEREVTGYDVDLLISALAKRGIPADQLEKLAQEVFGNEYDEKRTAYMIERGTMLPRIRDVGSFVFKLSPETKALFLRALGGRFPRTIMRKKLYSGKVVERYIGILKKVYCKSLICDEDTATLKDENLTVEFSNDTIGTLLPDDYYRIYLYREKLTLPKEIEIEGKKRNTIIYPAHILAVGEKSIFAIRILVRVNIGKIDFIHYPVEKKGKKNRFTVLTDRLDEFLETPSDFPVEVVYTPFPEFLLKEHKGIIFAGSSIEKAVKEGEFAKVLGVADSLKEVQEVLEGKKRFKKPLEVGIKFFKKEIKELIEWIKLAENIPPCIEKYLDNIEKDKNPYRVQALLSFLKKFASEIYSDYTWVINELLDIAVRVSEKNGSVSAKTLEITLPPFFPCISFARDYCPHGDWRECNCQKFGDVHGVRVDSVSLREKSAVFELNVVGQGRVRKAVQNGLEVDRIVRKLGAMVEPALLKYYKPMLELEVSRALSEAEDVLYPTNLKAKILHFAKEALAILVVEGRFAVKEENGEPVFYFPVNYLKSVVKSQFERPIAVKVSFEEIDYIIDENLGSFIVEGQIKLHRGKVRKAYRLPQKALYWFLESVESTQTPEYYVKRFETALEIAEEKIPEWEKKEKLSVENFGVTEDVIDKMEEDPFFKEKTKKAVKKKITGEETTEDRFERLLPSEDAEIVVRYEPDETEDLPEEVLQDFGINTDLVESEDWKLEVGETKQDGKVKITRIDEYTLLYERGEKKVYLTKNYERFVSLLGELAEKYGEKKVVPVLTDNDSFLYFIFDRLFNLNVSKDEVKFRIPEEVDENKKERIWRKAVSLLIKEMGLERYENMLIRSQLGDKSQVKEALKRLKELYQQVEREENQEETLTQEEKQIAEDIMDVFEE